MTLYNAPNLTTGIDQALVDVAIAVPSFIPMFLIFIFGTILIGGAISQKAKTGFADFSQWGLIASISVLMIALPLTLVSGLISLKYLSMVVAGVLAMGVWFFFDRSSREI